MTLRLESRIRRLRYPCPGFSLIVIAIIVILIALLLPMVGIARARARQTQCGSQLSQIYKGWTTATSKVPGLTSVDWQNKVRPYLEQESKIYKCPDEFSGSGNSYGMNTRAFRMQSPDNGRILVLDYKVAEVSVVGQTRQQLDNTWPVQLADRHSRRQNVLFVDGHVDASNPNDIDPRFCVNYDRYWRPKRDLQTALTDCLAMGATPSPGPGSTGGAATGTTAGGATGAGTTAGATTGGSTSAGTTGGGTTSTATTGGSTTSGGTTGVACPMPPGSPVPCFDANSGFPEMNDAYLWETNVHRCNAACVCTRRFSPSMDPMDNFRFLLIPLTPDSYSLQYFDYRPPGGMPNFEMRITRTGPTITIQGVFVGQSYDPVGCPVGCPGASTYTAYLCNPQTGGTKIPGLEMMTTANGLCPINVVDQDTGDVATGTIASYPCTP